MGKGASSRVTGTFYMVIDSLKLSYHPTFNYYTIISNLYWTDTDIVSYNKEFFFNFMNCLHNNEIFVAIAY